MKNTIWLLLLAVFFKQLSWSAFIPLWQTPDEQAHYGEVNLFSQIGGTKKTGDNLSREILISERIMGTERDDFGNNKFTYHPEYRTPYSPDLEQEIANQQTSSRSEFVKKESTGYPPLYYRLASLVEGALSFGSIFDRVFVVRIFSGLILVGLVFVAYLVGKELLDSKDALFLATLVAYMPMLTFVHAGVTSDTLFNFLFSLFLLACLRRNWFMIIVIFGLALLTKPQAYMMGFVVLPLLLNPALILLAVIMLLPLVGLVQSGKLMVPETGGMKIADFFSPAFIEHLRFTLGHTYREVLPWYWGVFRWLSLGLPEILRKLTNWLTVLSFIGFGIYVIRNASWKLLFLGYAMIIYFLAITIFDFGFSQNHGYSFGIQGRYFFPIIVAQMAIFIVGLKPVSKWLAIGMIAFNIFVFFWVMGSYHEISWPGFFIEAGQYKPEWVKFPVNTIIFIFYIVTGCALAIKLPDEKK